MGLSFFSHQTIPQIFLTLSAKEYSQTVGSEGQ